MKAILKFFTKEHGEICIAKFYQAAFNAGLDAAAKVCDDLGQYGVKHLFVPGPEHYKEAIRALEKK